MEVVTKTTTKRTTVTTSVTESSKTVDKHPFQKHGIGRSRKKQLRSKSNGRTTRKARVSLGVRAVWSEDTMKSAVETVRQNKMGLNQAAKQFDVPKATLQRHVKQLNKRSHDGKKQLGRSQDLTEEIENDLVSHILQMESRFYGLTRSSVLRLAYQIAERNSVKTRFNDDKQAAGKEWLNGFLKRHPEIALRIPEATSLARAAGFNRQRVTQFYTLLQKVVVDENLSASHIYNVDETGFTAVQKPQKVFARKGKHQVGAITSSERGKNVTFVCCVSATGHYIPPMVIYPRKRLKPDLTEGAPAGSIFQCQENGWINTELFNVWLEHFITVVQPSINNKILLILDGHVSHTQNITALIRAREVGIIMLSLPPHCTHRLQPLDLSFFKPLSTFYNQAIDGWMRANPGLPVGEQRITRFFGEAYNKAASVATAVNGFKAAGIWPVDPTVITDSEFAPSEVTEKPLPTMQSLEPSTRDSVTDIEQSLPDVEPDNSASNSTNFHQSVEAPSDSGVKMEQFKAASICPLPVRHQLVSRRRSTLGATLLTSSPYKKNLEEKLAKKNGKSTAEQRRLKMRKLVGLQETGNDRESRKQKEKNNTKAVKSVPSKMKKKNPDKKVKNSKKSTEGQRSRRMVIRPPKPVECRGALPRKPLWLQQKAYLVGVKSPATSGDDDVQTDRQPQQPLADVVEVRDTVESPATSRDDVQTDGQPQQPLADVVEVRDTVASPATTRNDTESSMSHLAVKSFYGTVSSRGRPLKRRVRAYSPTPVVKRKR